MLFAGSFPIFHDSPFHPYFCPFQMIDYCFTLFLLHFILVCIVDGSFPLEGAWWASMVVFQVVMMFAADFVAYKMSTLSYHSELDGQHELARTKRVVDLPDLDENEMTTAEKFLGKHPDK